VSSVRDADRIIGLLEAESMPPPRLICNRIRPAMVRRGDILGISDILDILAIELLGVVPDDESIVVSTNRGEPAALSQGSRAGVAFRNIARRVLGEDVPFMNLDETNGFLGRLKRMFGSTR
jgi:septum site-determining protein MinD